MQQEMTNFYIDDGQRLTEKLISLEEAAVLYSKDIFNAYPPSFYKCAMKAKEWQISMGECIGRLFNIKSVVDFGCGIGCYLEGFRKSGASVRGFEVSCDSAKEYISKDVIDFISKGDAMSNIDCGSYDMSMSIEVAEHILPDKSSILIDNLVKSSNEYILFTAAPPGQGGVCHINEKPMSFWIDLFLERGFNLSEDGTKEVKTNLNKLPYHSKYFSLIKRQVTIFRRNK